MTVAMAISNEHWPQRRTRGLMLNEITLLSLTTDPLAKTRSVDMVTVAKPRKTAPFQPALSWTEVEPLH
jgi:hypothetical protein